MKTLTALVQIIFIIAFIIQYAFLIIAFFTRELKENGIDSWQQYWTCWIPTVIYYMWFSKFVVDPPKAIKKALAQFDNVEKK